MSELREYVIIRTSTGDLTGELFVGADGLPELKVRYRLDHIGLPLWERFRPATCPADWWTIYPQPLEHPIGVLLSAWLHISDIQREIAEAQQAAEAQT